MVDRCVYDNAGRCVRTIHDVWASAKYDPWPGGVSSLWHWMFVVVGGVYGFLFMYWLCDVISSRLRARGRPAGLPTLAGMMVLSLITGLYAGNVVGDFYDGKPDPFQAAAVETNRGLWSVIGALPAYAGVVYHKVGTIIGW